MTEFAFQELLPIDHHDDTPYRKLTADHVATFTARGKTFLEVDAEALTLLTRTAMRDIAHLLRPGHLARLRAEPPPARHVRDESLLVDLLHEPNELAHSAPLSWNQKYPRGASVSR